MAVKRSDAGYAQLLRDQYSLLKDAVADFYAGESAKAIEIAARIRTLVHRTDKSDSLLSFIDPNYLQLPIFHKVLMQRAVLALNMGIQISGGGVAPRFTRPDFSGPSYSLVPLDRWWNEAYLAMGPTVRSSKKQIVLDVANKDGGAHVASEVPVRHAMATEPPVVFGSDGNFTRLNLARGTVAQAGSELLTYIEVHFRGSLSTVPAPTVETITIAAVAAGFRPMRRPDRLRLPFTRGSHFLNVHTDGKWAFYSELHDGKLPDNWGKDLESLMAFLYACRGDRLSIGRVADLTEA